MARSTRKADHRGMNWIRQDKRLALYLRDGAACVWCGVGAEAGVRLTLDHVVPHVEGGGNDEGNLVTACLSCNSRRQDRSVAAFAAAVAGYVGAPLTADALLADVQARLALPLAPYRAEARALIARRGSAARAVATLQAA